MKSSPQSVEKTPEMLEKWRLNARDKSFAYSISASALNDYISCPLRFYYKHILKLRAPVAPEMVEQMSLGRLFHQAIEALYRPMISRRLSKELLDEASKESKDLLRRLLSKAYDLPSEQLRGKSKLFYEILRRYLSSVIEFDQGRVARRELLSIRHLEHKIRRKIAVSTAEGEAFCSFYGICDRIDEVEDTYFVIDYKTGKSRRQTCPTLEDIFRTDRRLEYNQERQIGLYVWIAEEALRKKTKGALLSLRSLYLRSSGKRPLLTYAYDSVAFEEQLRLKVEEILDLSLPFKPVEEQEYCDTCPYHALCRGSR